jgi:glutaredoxin
MALWWSRKKNTPVDVILYTRQGCHLCEEAHAILLSEGANLRLTVIDVDSDPAVRAAHGEWVPVVAVDGKVRFRGRVNRVLLRRLLR